jgi:hypothetical protein
MADVLSKPEEPANDLLYRPPSQQSAQGPVAKPGEPVRPTKGILAEPKTVPKAEPVKPSSGSQNVAPSRDLPGVAGAPKK